MPKVQNALKNWSKLTLVLEICCEGADRIVSIRKMASCATYKRVFKMPFNVQWEEERKTYTYTKQKRGTIPLATPAAIFWPEEVSRGICNFHAPKGWLIWPSQGKMEILSSQKQYWGGCRPSKSNFVKMAHIRWLCTSSSTGHFNWEYC